MNRYRMARYYVAASVILPAAAIGIWPAVWWTVPLFAAWIALAALLWVWTDRKERDLRQERSIRTLQWTAIRTLNHHRHDWMNDLQVLYGYIRMNKPDKAIECVEKIRQRMSEESRIAKLGVPSLILFAQSFRTNAGAMTLHFDLPEELNLAELPLDAEAAAETLMKLINVYRCGVKPGLDEPAALTVRLALDDKRLTASLTFEGECIEPKEMQDQIRQHLKRSPFRAEGMDPKLREVLLTAAFGG